jgi:DNA-binding transcriptional ArsR family regulator
VPTDRLSEIFAALADPTRRAILARLSESDATVNELAEPFAISLPAVSRHLKVLERAGLITRSRSAQWRSSSLRAEPLREATAWMERYRVFWDANLDRLEAHLKLLQQQADLTHPPQPMNPTHPPQPMNPTHPEKGS